MTQNPDTDGFQLGLCRKPPTAHILGTGLCFPAGTAREGWPDSSGGRPGSIRRGIEAAIAGMKTLNRNPQLLWFAVLAGLVFIGNAICQGILGYITWTIVRSEAEWIVLNLIIEFLTLFCLVFLLTGLVLSIPVKKDGHASVFEGLSGAKKYLKPIGAWSFILALAGMLLFSMYFYSPGWLPRNPLNLSLFGTLYGWVNLLVEYPFNPMFANIFSDPTRFGGLSPTYWIYPSGVVQALTFSAINLFLFILTLFVVPLLVLGQKNLRDAVTGSFTLGKKTWAELTSCGLFLGAIIAGVFLTYLLVQAVSGMAMPGETAMIHPETSWIAFALVYDIALFGFVLVMAMIGGITVTEIYSSAKHRQSSTSPEDTPEVA